MAVHQEKAFEDELCEHLAAHGWLYSKDDTGYDVERALFPEDVLGWLQDTQPDAFAKAIRPGLNSVTRRQAEAKILDRLARVMGSDSMNGGGTLNALKQGFSITGPGKFQMFQIQPADGLNRTTVERYGKNRLRIMRQVHYSAKNRKSLDLVFFVNGLPVATAELKTDLTQSIQDALAQFRQDRQPKGEPLLEFGRGALVHFVVSNEEIYMATELKGVGTRFLPFNAGWNNGAGNPLAEDSSPTSYFWERVLDRDEWLTIIGKFVHYRHTEDEDPITGKKFFRTHLRFPRYHQWRAVNKLAAAAREEGPGHSYLIQHSAGSGKTDSIAWTAHRMASLHREDGSKVFDSVIVISDRTVLDGQLQKAVEQLETVKGVFQAIKADSEGAKSRQLADALIKGKQIIGVTLQTFPHALEEIRKNKGLKGRAYAVIADEAHSSQSGEAAKTLKSVLTGVNLDPEEDITAEDVLTAEMAARAGDTERISFFAFTATPKAKTIQMFGRRDDNGIYRAFDLYSMKQAIEEGFILDVLKNYVTYEMAARIARQADDGTETDVDRDKGAKEMMQWVKLHPHNIAQKVQIIVEHFRENVTHHLAGRAKAMVVTSSRKEAVRYKKAIDEYIAEQGYPLGTLVAFSGDVSDPETGADLFNEHNLNPGLNGRSLTKAFDTDRYQIMLVANKFQTGFDQPLLVGMYVDKKLSGITAVQTLSRLNRVIAGKEQTYVLDFVNDPQIILEAFQTYYEDAEIQGEADPDIVHDMVSKLDAMNIYDDRDVDAVARAWIVQRNHNGLYAKVRPGRDVFRDRMKQARLTGDELEIARLEEFRSTIGAFLKAYDFFSQIIDYGDTRIEKLSIYLKLLARLIRNQGGGGPALDLSDVVLTHYALKKQEAADLKLQAGQAGALQPMTAAGSGAVREKKKGSFDEIIEHINKLFAGSGLGDEDQINAISSIMRHAVSDEQLQGEAMANSPEDFNSSPTITNVVEGLIYSAGEGHQKAINVLLESGTLNGLIDVLNRAGLYQSLRERAEADAAEEG